MQDNEERLHADLSEATRWIQARPSAEEYLEAFRRESLSDSQVTALHLHLNDPGCWLSPGLIYRSVYGKPSRHRNQGVNSLDGNLGKRIAGYLHILNRRVHSSSGLSRPLVDDYSTVAIMAELWLEPRSPERRCLYWRLYPEVETALSMLFATGGTTSGQQRKGLGAGANEKPEESPLAAHVDHSFASPETIVEIERRSVDFVVREYERRDWHVTSRERDKGLGYDIECTKGSEQLHVEVKGTAEVKVEFAMQASQVRASQEDPCWQLAVVCQALSAPELREWNASEFRAGFDKVPTEYRVWLRERAAEV